MAYDKPEEYDKRYLKNKAERYLHDLWHPHLISKIKELCSERVILDVGCGSCEFTRHMREAKLTIGLDSSLPMLACGRKKLADQDTLLIYGDGQRLPIRSGVVEAIFAIGLIPYVDMRTFLGECQRVLGDGGQTMLVFVNKWNASNLESRLYRKIALRLGRRVWVRQEHSYREVRAALMDFGFTVKEMGCFGMLTPCPLSLQRYVKYLWLFMEKIYAPFQRFFPLGSSIMVIAQK